VIGMSPAMRAPTHSSSNYNPDQEFADGGFSYYD
jgi:hypothetical protein